MRLLKKCEKLDFDWSKIVSVHHTPYVADYYSNGDIRNYFVVD